MARRTSGDRAPQQPGQPPATVVTSGGDIQQIGPGEVYNVNPPVVADATKVETREARQRSVESAPEVAVSWFQVLQPATISSNGSRTRLHLGKELNNLNYNIADLRRQGVQLREIPPPGVGG